MTTPDVFSQLSEAISAAINPVIGENELLRESIEDIRAQFAYEDRGWTAIGGLNSGERTAGLDLKEVKTISKLARTKVAASSLPKHAADLHHGYVFGNGVEIDGTVQEEGKRGRPDAKVAFFQSSVNQESVFSGAAKRELQYARFTDGNVIAFCDKVTKEIRRVPISEISGVLVNPDHPDEIWAWLREWTYIPANGNPITRKSWAYTNRFTESRQETITDADGDVVGVLPNVTAVDLRANRQVGWVFGIPDATAGIHWAEAYGEVLRYGQIVNESLAKIVYKVVSKTQKGAQAAGLKMAGPGIAQAAVVGEGQDVALVNSSQRSFDFTAARPLAAMAAAAWNISNIDLLSDSSAAGSSYGAAQSLNPGIQNAMSAMREEWTQFYEDIFVACGFTRSVIHWPDMSKPDAYRMAQELTLYSIALTDQEYRELVLDRLDIAGDSKIIPPTLQARSQPTVQAASPDQGQNSPAGSADSSLGNDTRSDGIAEVMKQMQNEDFLNEMRSLVDRMEAVKS